MEHQGRAAPSQGWDPAGLQRAQCESLDGREVHWGVTPVQFSRNPPSEVLGELILRAVPKLTQATHRGAREAMQGRVLHRLLSPMKPPEGSVPENAIYGCLPAASLPWSYTKGTRWGKLAGGPLAAGHQCYWKEPHTLQEARKVGTREPGRYLFPLWVSLAPSADKSKIGPDGKERYL